jgi:hypothetical protein
MPAIIPVVAAAFTYAEVAESAEVIAALGTAGAAAAGAAAAVVVGYETSRLMGLNDGQEVKPTTPAGAQVDTVGTFAGIPVLYGSRRVGGVRVLTESASSGSSRFFEVFTLTVNYRVANGGSGFVQDVNVVAFVDGPDGSVDQQIWTRVASSPGPSQYAVDSQGNYTFSAADPQLGRIQAQVQYIANVINDQLHMVIVWGMGQINAVSQIYLDDVPITDPRFSGLVYVENYVGTDTQAASAVLIAALSGKWTSAHQLRGLAYSYVQLQWNEGAFPRGKPNITADIQGMLVFDPRSSSTVFSNNPWLCIRDYLTSTRYGWKVPAASIDDTAFGAEANYADQAVSVPTAGGTTTQARYACDGVLDIDRSRQDNMNGLLSACRGFLVYSGGLYKAKSEAVVTPVSFTLTEDNIVGGWSIQLPQRRAQYNRMRANFFDAANLWQSNVALQDSTVYRAADGGALFEGSLDVPFTTNVYRASQLAMMELKQSRFGIGVSLRASIAALQLEVGDVVPVTHTTPGWVSQLFRVMSIELMSNDEVSLGLTQYDPSVYTLDALSFVIPPPATQLPDPNHVIMPGAPVVSEDLYATTGSAGVKSRAIVSWIESADIFVRNGGYYEIGVSLAQQNDWSTFSHIHGTSYELDDVAPGTYDFRIAAVNSLGVKSPYQLTTKELIGLSAPPSDIANFAVQSFFGVAKFTWQKLSANSDLDVTIGGRVFIRWSPKTVGASWNDGTLINPDGYPGDTSISFGPLTTGTYMAKARDSSGNYSVNAASFVVTEAVLTALTTITAMTESPTFPGAKTNVYVDAGTLLLTGTTLIDAMAALIDSWGFIDGLGGISGTGSYAFASKMDLGSVQPARLVASIDSTAFDVDDLIDSRIDPIDSWGPVDGGVIEDAEVQLMVRSTNDDPNASPSWGPWHALGQVGDYNSRGFDFRLDFASANATHNRRVSSLSVAAKH